MGEKNAINFEVDDEIAKNIITQLVELSFQTTAISSQDTRIESFKELPQLPTFNEIRDFIKTQSDYKHSVESVALHFAQRKVDSKENDKALLWLNAIRSASNRVRKEISDKESGVWDFERRDRQKTFTFIKNEEDIQTQSHLVDENL